MTDSGQEEQVGCLVEQALAEETPMPWPEVSAIAGLNESSITCRTQHPSLVHRAQHSFSSLFLGPDLLLFSFTPKLELQVLISTAILTVLC